MWTREEKTTQKTVEDRTLKELEKLYCCTGLMEEKLNNGGKGEVLHTEELVFT